MQDQLKARGYKQIAVPSIASKLTDLELWHHNLGHLNESGLKKMAREGVVRGLPTQFVRELQFCEGCGLRKSSTDPFLPRGPAHKARYKLEIVNTLSVDQ